MSPHQSHKKVAQKETKVTRETSTMMEEPCDDIQNERSEKILTAAMSANKKGMSVTMA